VRPAIIDFSNYLCYNGEIRPLRNPDSAPRPHLVEYVVDSLVAIDAQGKENRDEAHVIAALIKACTELEEYRGKSLCAITLVGDDQAHLIYDVVVGLVGAIELERRHCAVGKPGQFQGDERDVVFLSMVDAPVGHPLPIRQTDLFKQRFNVASSRAKDQLWLVHSLDPGRDLREMDLRRRLIDHVRNPAGRRREIEHAQSRAESPLEEAVIARLAGAGYIVKSQVWVGSYRLDLVVGSGSHLAAIECDGDRYHGLDQIPADMARQAILERAGWQFIRVRGTRFFRDPENTTEWILSELTRLGVEPGGGDPAPTSTGVEGSALRERVVRRAHEIMVEAGWGKGDGNDVPS
jgi:very-short-patch-repair endonuclease